MKVEYGKLRHLCDDPVCPDPVWNLSVSDRVKRSIRNEEKSMKSVELLGGRCIGNFAIQCFDIRLRLFVAWIHSLRKSPQYLLVILP